MPVLASGYFQGRKQTRLEVKGFCKSSKLFEKRMLGVPEVGRTKEAFEDSRGLER